ncbi:MAG: alpha/beta fold hydrolase [Acidimicrobiales bacterium]|nr:alpha/beta fold hydrolase [Acidimicrobiales bacterium]
MGFLTIEHIAGPSTSAAPAVVLLHGLTQNRFCWGASAAQLGQFYSVWALDLPGHGSSGYANATFTEAVELVNETLAVLPFEADTVVGYSMGGRMALAAALERPDLADRLVLIGATAGLDDETERQQRVAADGALATRLRRDGPSAFLDYWLALPLFAGIAEDQQCRAERLEHWGSGVPESLELRGTGSMAPLWNDLATLAIPTLVIAGADDVKFVQIGEELVSSIGSSARFQVIPGAGHACHLSHAFAVTGVIRKADQPAADRSPTQ